MAGHILRLEDYTFPSTFTVSSMPDDSRIGTAESPRRDGVVVGDQYLAGRVITIRGMLRADTPDALRTAMDSLLAAVNAGRQKLYLWDDRYAWATKQTLSTDYDPSSFERYCHVTIGFLCDKAFWEALSETPDTWTSPVSGTERDIVVGGNAYTLPVFEITVGGTGLLDIELSVGDYVFTLEGNVTNGDVLIVDCSEESVELLADYSDYMSLFDLAFLRLVGGATNKLMYLKNSGVAVSQITTRWRDRWY